MIHGLFPLHDPELKTLETVCYAQTAVLNDVKTKPFSCKAIASGNVKTTIAVYEW